MEGRADSGAEASTSQAPPECYLIVHNVAKKHNIGTLARCATAFSVKQLCLVGSRQFNTFGAHGASEHVDFRHYPTLEDCVRDLKQNKGCAIVGVEILEGAQPVHRCPFAGSTAFMLGNEGQGLTAKQISLCDSFVYIQQYGAGTASLNVAVAASIVLHHFALWAGYAERQREGQKFVVAERPARTGPRGFVPLTPEEQAAERARRAARAADADADAAALPALFE